MCHQILLLQALQILLMSVNKELLLYQVEYECVFACFSVSVFSVESDLGVILFFSN
jgi:hypothetical protein